MARADRLKHRRIHVDWLAVNLGQASLDLVEAENHAGVERIDDEFAPFVHGLDQKMRWERDAEKVQTEAPSDLDVNDRQRNRDTEAAFKDVVKKRVARIAERVAITIETLLPEEKFGE